MKDALYKMKKRESDKSPRGASRIFLVLTLRSAAILLVSLLFLFSSCKLFFSGAGGASPTTYDGPEPFSGFTDPVAVSKYMSSFVEENSKLSSLHNLGTTSEGRDVEAVEISDAAGDFEAEPTVLIIGSIHGDEQAGAGLVIMLADYLAENYGSDVTVTSLVDSLHLHLLPVMNPDGMAMGSRYNANEVDLNRNFGYNWYEGEAHNGDAPFDQIESKLLADYVAEKGVSLAAVFHTTLREENIGIYAPWDAITTSTENFQDKYLPHYPFLREIGLRYAETVADSEPEFSDFRYMEGADWYVTYGSFADWALGERGIPAYTVELYPKQGYVSEDTNILRRLWRGHHSAIMSLIETAHMGAAGTVEMNEKNGDPIGGVEVTLRPMDSKSGSRVFVPRNYTEIGGYSRSDGYFRLLCPSRHWRIELEKEGFSSLSEELFITESGETRGDDGTTSRTPLYELLRE